MEFDLRKWLGFIQAETRYFGRELTQAELVTCRDIYLASTNGWKSTKREMRTALRSGMATRGPPHSCVEKDT